MEPKGTVKTELIMTGAVERTLEAEVMGEEETGSIRKVVEAMVVKASASEPKVEEKKV